MFTSMAQLSSSFTTTPTLYEKNGDLKVTGETYPPKEKVVILADTTKSLSDTTQKIIATGDLLPEQGKFQGPMETWPNVKSQVLTKA